MATVAVVTPTILGRADLFLRAMESVWAQDREPDQMVVEEDFKRTGAARTRNRALERVWTDYVAPLDDDDRLLPNHLDVLMREAERDPELDVIYPTPDIRGMDFEPAVVRYEGVVQPPWGLPWSKDHELYLRFTSNPIPHTCLIKTQAIRDVGGYPEPGHPDYRLTDCDDWLLFRNLVKSHKNFHHVNKVTWVWEKHDAHTGGRGV